MAWDSGVVIVFGSAAGCLTGPLGVAGTPALWLVVFIVSTSWAGVYWRSGVGFVASRVGQGSSERSNWDDRFAAKRLDAASIYGKFVNPVGLFQLCDPVEVPQ